MSDKYKFMWKKECIGELRAERTMVGIKLSVQFDPSKEDLIPYDLKIRMIDYKLDHDKVWDWIVSRIIPATQDGIEEKMEWLGLTEYSEWQIFKMSYGMNNMDYAWIDFADGTLDVTKHPKYKYM